MNIISTINVNLIYEPMVNKSDNKIYMCSKEFGVTELQQFNDEAEASNYEYKEGDSLTQALKFDQDLRTKLFLGQISPVGESLEYEFKIIDICLKPNIFMPIGNLCFEAMYRTHVMNDVYRILYLIPLEDIQMFVNVMPDKQRASFKAHAIAQLKQLNLLDSVHNLDACMLSNKLLIMDQGRLKNIKRISQPMKLQHIARHSILKLISYETHNIEQLPIPKPIKLYINAYIDLIHICRTGNDQVKLLNSLEDLREPNIQEIAQVMEVVNQLSESLVL